MGLLIPNNLSMTTFGVIKCPPACYAFEIRVVLPAVGCRESGPCELVTCNNPICNRLQPLSPGKNPSHHRQSNWDGTNGGFAKTKRRSPRLGHWRRLASRSFAVLGPNVCHQHPRSLQSTPICLVHPCRDRGDHPCPQHSDTTQHNTATTVLSIDGVGAYDTISRTSMLQGLFNTPAANQCLRALVVCHGVGIRLAR